MPTTSPTNPTAHPPRPSQPKHRPRLHPPKNAQALEEGAASLRADLDDKYASADDKLRSLSAEKRSAESAVVELRAQATALEERQTIAKNDLKVERGVWYRPAHVKVFIQS